MQADVVDELVPRPAQEGGVDRDHRAQAAHRHARGGGDRVLLGDADVEAAVGEALGERQQPGGAGHARGDGDDLGPCFGRARSSAALNAPVYDEPLAPTGTPVSGSNAPMSWRRFSSSVSAGRYPSPLRVSTCTTTGPRRAPRVAQHRLERGDVVAVDRADVVEPERAGRTPTGRRRRSDRRGEPRHGGRVAAAVVVEHDHRAPPAVPEVVQRLVGEPAGERAVADHRDDLAVVTGGAASRATASPYA